MISSLLGSTMLYMTSDDVLSRIGPIYGPLYETSDDVLSRIGPICGPLYVRHQAYRSKEAERRSNNSAILKLSEVLKPSLELQSFW